MKKLRIFHETEYRYSKPVVLGNHKLLIRPRDGHDIRIESSRLDITPPNSVTSWHRDELDNSVALVTFDDAPVSKLIITSEVIVAHYLSMREYLPLDPHVATYPFEYSAAEFNLLAAYFDNPQGDPVIDEWVRTVIGNETSTEAILQALCSAIYTFRYQLRDEEGVQLPATTLQMRSGSCRDYAWLFVTATRSLGFAARFVSGYFNTEGTPLEDGNTHAWAEVYLPGAGWTGFDPTSNHISAENHIPVCVAINPEAIPPVSGSYTGLTGQMPTMKVRLSVHPC